jgi:ribonuclease BN (tRNA processing enzyme)
MLGTGTPFADPDRSGPAVAIVSGGRAFVVDAGPGVVRRAAAAAARRELPELAPGRLSVVLLTHLHSDHTAGLADLILSTWVLGRSTPLRVIGPPGTKAMVRHLLAAYREDIALRRRVEPGTFLGSLVSVVEVQPGVVYHDTAMTITAFQVRHGGWKHAFGYRFNDRVVVMSGDTGPTDAIARECHGCDVLLHEAYSGAKLALRPAPWQQYHSTYHTAALEVGRIAAASNPGLLVLYHQLYFGASDQDLLDEVARNYGGRTVAAHDLDIW